LSFEELRGLREDKEIVEFEKFKTRSRKNDHGAQDT